jgi:putative heme-binding domain-containing protein
LRGDNITSPRGDEVAATMRLDDAKLAEFNTTGGPRPRWNRFEPAWTLVESRPWMGRGGLRSALGDAAMSKRVVRGLRSGCVWAAAWSCLLLGAAAARADVEPWADARLPVREGLRAWLDADRWPEGERPAPGDPIAAWRDGSGDHRDFAQPDAQSRPLLVAADGRSFVRFDGAGDYLEAKGLDADAREATAFIVVAATTNLGGFRGILAGAKIGENDYTSGLNVDLGPSATTRLEVVNVEGRGFQGFANVVASPRDLREFVVLAVRVGADVAAWIDEAPRKTRPREVEPLTLDRIILGARLLSNEKTPPYIQCFLHGDVAEVLLYDRALGDDEVAAVQRYLAEKHEGLTDALRSVPAEGGRLLETVENPPPFQVLVPGFEVVELPIDLKNVNTLKRRPDGTLFAVGYDGAIHILSDADGDGLEETAKMFWDGRGSIIAPLDAALTPPGYKLGDGLFIPCGEKLVLVVDMNGDGEADREIVVAEGWPARTVAVDVMGVALGPDGSVYLGTGCQKYQDAYQIDGAGIAHYDLKSERGTILKIAPDLKSREIVATGVRFPIGMEFNAEGDLFATDQEGATWLPNGNPLDELLHIRVGRHYGFPPRHGKHLPGVIDEPSTFDYAPQHQSTCGLTFNGVGDEPRFGPSWWAGDAIVAGYSRGKVYRTHLAKVRGEYVARNDLIAGAGMLLVDACVGADGSLVVAAHSGRPDWGSGPQGDGKLFKIRYADPDLPQPSLAWSSGPREVRVAFDRPVDPASLHGVREGTRIESGEAVAAADRFETLRPGYAVVARQMSSPRMSLAVRGVGLSPDRRTLILTTDAQTVALPHAVTIPGLGRTEVAADAGRSAPLPQRAETDLAFNLSGVDARWTGADGGRSARVWLPHLDLSAAAGLTLASAEHDAFRADLATPGELTMQTQIRLKDLLRPAVQPGSKVDPGLPPERPTLVFRGLRGTRVEAPGAMIETNDASEGMVEIVASFDPVSDRPVPLTVACPTGPGATLEFSYRTDEDSRLRVLAPGRMLLPWAGAAEATRAPSKEETFPADYAGGDWLRGRAVFHGEAARCSRCHSIRGEGGTIGPDLSNLVERDFESVLRDVSQPNAAINPDFIAYQVATVDGRVLTGSIKADGDRIHVGLTTGEEVTIQRDEVEEMAPATVSVMPEGLPAVIGAESLKDLMAFLLLDPPAPAPIHRDDAPPPRTRAEWDAAIQGRAAPADAAAKPLRITLAAGPKDHGIDEHDYPLWLARWSKLLRSAPNVVIREVADGDGLEFAAESDVIVWYSANRTWDESREPKLRAYLDGGGGLVVLHWGVNGQKSVAALADLIGLASNPTIKYRHGPLDLTLTDPKSPITAGLPSPLRFVDESYWLLVGDPSRVDVLATGVEEGEPRPLIWTRRQGEGRVFVSILGHYIWTFDDPLYRLILLRAIAWTADQPIDRLIDLSTVGARLE